MARKKKISSNGKKELIAKIVKKHLAKDSKNELENSQYTTPQYIVDMCLDLNNHLKLNLDSVIIAESKASVEQDYIEAFTKKLMEL